MRPGDQGRIAALRRFGSKGKATQRAQYLVRVEAFIEEHVHHLTDRVPLEELVAAVEPVYRQAKLRGYRRGVKARRRIGGSR